MSDRGLWAEAGDTFFTRSHTFLGMMIRWGQRDPGEEKSETNHTGVVVKSGWIRRPDNPMLDVGPNAVIIEALWKVREGPLKLNGVTVRVFRPVPPYDEQELAHFRHEASTYVGKRYGWWKLGGFLLKRFTRIDITQWYFIKGRPICSFLAGWVNQKAQSVKRILRRRLGATPPDHVGLSQAAVGSAQYPFGMPPQAADPDEMMDYCLAHPEEWVEVK